MDSSPFLGNVPHIRGENDAAARRRIYQYLDRFEHEFAARYAHVPEDIDVKPEQLPAYLAQLAAVILDNLALLRSQAAQQFGVSVLVRGVQVDICVALPDDLVPFRRRRRSGRRARRPRAVAASA